jgi:spore maturation protein CgeB
MKILIYDCLPDPSFKTHPAKETFSKLGHNVDYFDWRTSTSFYKDYFSIALEKIFFKFFINKINKKLLEFIKFNHYDLILVFMGKHIFPETLNILKKHCRCLASFNNDYFSNTFSSSNYVLQSIPIYDLHFTPRYHLIDEYIKCGAKNVYKIDWFYYSNFFRNYNLDLKFKYLYNLGFIGSWSKKRESYIKAIFGESDYVNGWGWKKKYSNNHDFTIGNIVPFTKMNNLFFHTKINLNFLTDENKDTSNSRNFEIPSSLGFQLSERSKVIENLFKEDLEIVLFSSEEELKSKILFYVKNDNLRQKISIAGWRRLLDSNYSLESRLKYIIKKCKQFLF